MNFFIFIFLINLYIFEDKSLEDNENLQEIKNLEEEKLDREIDQCINKNLQYKDFYLFIKKRTKKENFFFIKNNLVSLYQYEIIYNDITQDWFFLLFSSGKEENFIIKIGLSLKENINNLASFFIKDTLKLSSDKIFRNIYFDLEFRDEDYCESFTILETKNKYYFSDYLKSKLTDLNKIRNFLPLKNLARIYDPKTFLNNNNVNQLTQNFINQIELLVDQKYDESFKSSKKIFEIQKDFYDKKNSDIVGEHEDMKISHHTINLAQISLSSIFGGINEKKNEVETKEEEIKNLEDNISTFNKEAKEFLIFDFEMKKQKCQKVIENIDLYKKSKKINFLLSSSVYNKIKEFL